MTGFEPMKSHERSRPQLEFEKAAVLRDQIKRLREQQLLAQGDGEQWA